MHERSYLTSVDYGHVSDGNRGFLSVHETNQTQHDFDISVRHASCTVTGCAFVARYQNTSNLENHCVTAGTDHKELADRLTVVQHFVRQERLGSTSDGRITLSHTFVAPAFTSDKKSRCDIKFVKWLVRKNRPLSCKAPSILHPIL